MDDAQDERDRKDDSQAFLKDIAHMHRVFDREADANQLKARYDAELLRLMRERHARAFRKLAKYAADDSIDSERIGPFVTSTSIERLVSNRDALIGYLAADMFIADLHDELSRFV